MQQINALPAAFTGPLVHLQAPHTQTPADYLHFFGLFDDAMAQMCPDYQRGQVSVDLTYLTPRGGFWFFLPTAQAPRSLLAQGDLTLTDWAGRPYTMSLTAAGLAGTLCALGRWLETVAHHAPRYEAGRRYYDFLRGVALRHPDGAQIWRVLD